MSQDTSTGVRRPRSRTSGADAHIRPTCAKVEPFRAHGRSRDAIWSARDPWPFLLEHHRQVPVLLARSLVRGRDWIRIDFNIGKLVEAAGD